MLENTKKMILPGEKKLFEFVWRCFRYASTRCENTVVSLGDTGRFCAWERREIEHPLAN